jgi:hypothetical protein
MNNKLNRKSTSPRRDSHNIISIIIVLLIASTSYLFSSSNQENNTFLSVSLSSAGTHEPQFKKEGELIFLRKENGKEIKKIAIEIPDSDAEIRQGLMYRSSLPESAGMLFIYEKSGLKVFWMKNTKIPLDIIFIDEKREIVTIQKHTVPYSEHPIPSHKNAKYIVEVNAGFCDKYQIKEGDKIRF